MTLAKSASFSEHDDWLMERVDRTEFSPPVETGQAQRARHGQFPLVKISAEMVAAAVLSRTHGND